MSAMEPARPNDSFTSVDAVAGFLAAASVVFSALAMHLGFVLGLPAHPARTAPVAVVLAIVAGVMSTRFQPMARKAMLFAALAWVVGMTLAVVDGASLL